MTSPYEGLTVEQWRAKTLELVEGYPVSMNELYKIAHRAWEDIFHSQIGTKPFKIGIDLVPSPQIMGFFLHELIPLELQYRYAGVWRRGMTSNEKDVVYIPDDTYSLEIKTSSSGRNIYGSRSYAQIGSSTKKSKTGYYLAVNFEKFSLTGTQPRISLVRFGWIDHEDWIGQTAATGQQARLSPAWRKISSSICR